uniref:Serpin B6 (Placental thrombin inhibitor) n=1 Tax=Schistosoma japonicum TaxID=6182 RepID=C1L425_SCHJA|nr:Serpin B6 (Placental thrombin inhibitor) [Schistosoma japonicum]
MAALQSLTNFTDKFYEQMLKEIHGHWINTFLSPFNIYTAIAMVLCGSDNNTKAEMIRAMELSDCLEHAEVHSGIGALLKDCCKSDEGVEIILGNKLFAEQSVSIKERFKNDLKRYYDASAENMPFQLDPISSRLQINQWVSEQTKGKIQELLSPDSITQDTSVVVTATTYFKGMWKLPFPEYNSHVSEFHKLDGSNINVKLMFNEANFNLTSLPHLQSRAIKIPFKNPKFTLLVVLPDANNGLPDLLKLMYKKGGISSLLSNNFVNTKLKLYLPKFKLKEANALNLKNHLLKLGMIDAFCSVSADFRNISDSDKLFISDVMHKAILEVDEEGAVAASASATVMYMCSAIRSHQPVPEFRIDHPFFISIIWNDCLPLFLGHVVAPMNE